MMYTPFDQWFAEKIITHDSGKLVLIKTMFSFPPYAQVVMTKNPQLLSQLDSCDLLLIIFTVPTTTTCLASSTP